MDPPNYVNGLGSIWESLKPNHLETFTDLSSGKLYEVSKGHSRGYRL